MGVSGTATQPCRSRTRATDNMYVTGCGCVTIKLYLPKQGMSQIGSWDLFADPCSRTKPQAIFGLWLLDRQ